MKVKEKAEFISETVCAKDVVRELNMNIIPEKAEFLPRFFDVSPGGYGEGDKFIGVLVPAQRKVAKNNYDKISLSETEKLLSSAIHEHRLTALFILLNKFGKAKTGKDQKTIADIYLKNLQFVNNWDLVDASAPQILGAYLYDKPREILYELANSGDLWNERIAILSTFFFIKNKDFKDAFAISDILLNREHDLIHKAVGWMIREVGNRDLDEEIAFLKPRYKKMPRTMLRYAIEKFEETLRQDFLKGRY